MPTCSTFAEHPWAPALARAAGLMALASLALPACVQRPPDPTQPEPPAQPAPRVPEPPAPPPGALVQVTVLSAEIQGRMANGAPWDGAEQVEPVQIPGPLARYLEQHPELAGAIDRLGVPVDDESLHERARASEEADPMVIVELGDGPVFRSPVAPRSFTPLWDFPFRFVHGEVAGRQGVPPGAFARVHVVDYDGPLRFEPIGTTVLPVDELVAAPLHTLGPFGGVTKLVLQVRALPLPGDPGAAHEHRVAVPGQGPWIDTGVDIQAGQRVLIRAADEICTSERAEHCNGPEGQVEPHPRYNLPGFSALGHGALVGAVGDARFPVQRHRELVAPASGRLRLGINDSHAGNNRGAFAVHILVHALP